MSKSKTYIVFILLFLLACQAESSELKTSVLVDRAINKVLLKAKARFGGKKGKKKEKEDEKEDKGFDLFAKLRAYSKALIKGGHKLRFEGKSELVIHSTPKKLNAFLLKKQEDVHAGKGSDPKHAEKQKALNSIKPEKKNFGKILGKYKAKQKANYNASVKPDYKLLKASLKSMAKDLGIVGINIEDTTLATTKVQHSMSGGKALRVWAEPLTKIAGNTHGSSPGSSVPKGWEKIEPSDRSKNWVRAHLVNHHLHGPGKEWNLFPAHKTVNSDMEAKIESVAKKKVHSKGEGVYYYDASLTYGNGDFPTKLDVSFGEYDTDKKTRKEIKSYSKPLTQPSISYTVDLNADSAGRLQEVAKTNGVTGLSTFFNNLVKERKDSGRKFADTDDVEERVEGVKDSHIDKLDELIRKKLINI